MLDRELEADSVAASELGIVVEEHTVAEAAAEAAVEGPAPADTA